LLFHVIRIYKYTVGEGTEMILLVHVIRIYEYTVGEGTEMKHFIFRTKQWSFIYKLLL